MLPLSVYAVKPAPLSYISCNLSCPNVADLSFFIYLNIIVLSLSSSDNDTVLLSLSYSVYPGSTVPEYVCVFDKDSPSLVIVLNVSPVLISI